MGQIATRKLGSTGLTVTRLGLGLAALGRPGYINIGHRHDLPVGGDVALMQAHAHKLLDHAWAAGIRYFDAARSYGEAERFLGSWLTACAIAPDSCTVGSKWGYEYTANWKVDAKVHEQKEHSLARLQQQWPETQERLGEQLDIYMIHSANVGDGLFDQQDLLARLSNLRAGGIAIGLSSSGVNQAASIERALEIEVDGRQLFTVVQATWNLLERSAESCLRHAHHQGVGIVVKETLANGRLSSRNSAPEFTEQLKLLQDQAQRQGTSIEGLAIAACLAQDWIDVALTGAATIEQLDDNLRAARNPLDPEAFSRLDSVMESGSDYWRTRSQLHWN
jgi:aryl-alcohol dehydrogenase-like predicted oxidoreductase